MQDNIGEISLPCLRAKMGDTFYYYTVMSFGEVAKRIKLPEEIDERYKSEELMLGDWIQRKIDDSRITSIVEYLKNQDQRFFNSIIVGLFDGSPEWQDISIKNPTIETVLSKESIEYFNRTIGILTLTGEEAMFAIDGQHRAIGIRRAVEKYKNLSGDEVSVIFIGHKTDQEGTIRTRRLFSTLNRYAKPVGKSDIIALSEDDNCAIITRNLIENYELLKDKVIINKSVSISPSNTKDFTNVRTLYDLIERITTDRKVYSYNVNGESHASFTNTRVDERKIQLITNGVKKLIKEVLTSIPAFNTFLKTQKVDRTNLNCNLIFRPIGQTILFDVIKVCESMKKLKAAKDFFSKNDFNLKNPIWYKIFWDLESSTLKTDKPRIRYAVLLILEHLAIKTTKTRKDLEMFETFKISPEDL